MNNTDDTGRKISMLFLTHNKADLTTRCFKSLDYTLERDDVLEWIIIDNASTDQYFLRWLSELSLEHKKIKLYGSKENLGVAGGRNRLMRLAQGDTFLSLDSDVLDKSRKFIPALATMLDQPGIGIVGLHGAFLLPNWKWVDSQSTKYSGYVEAVTGYCQMFNRSIYDDGCEYDEFYNPYWIEDTDFCFQIRYHFKLKPYVLGMGDSGLIHKWGQTNSGGDRERRKRWNYFVKKWQPVYDDMEKITKLQANSYA